MNTWQAIVSACNTAADIPTVTSQSTAVPITLAPTPMPEALVFTTYQGYVLNAPFGDIYMIKPDGSNRGTLRV